MYCTFYGLKERPFTLTPNPDFIFLGRAHQEAFAHLIYGIEQKAGFIALTGEVGAGKTTVMRTLLTRLTPESYATALILNPMLSSLGLLKTINREFGIADQGDEPAELVEILNRFLLQQKESGRTVVLVIDEAQDMERDVLEQVRLLSNLETAREKLIQIILVGQPELETLLSQPELRQLNQRITVRYHLTPMDAADTRDYIAHRLRVAGGTPDMVRFAQGAVTAIHRFAGGLPRLVNAVADRALLIGYTAEARQIETHHARQAIGEVAPAERRRSVRRTKIITSAVTTVLLVASVFVILLLTLPKPVAVTPAPPVARPQQKVVPLAGMLQQLQESTSIALAYQTVLKAWNITLPAGVVPDNTLDAALKRAGLDLFRYTGNLGGLARMGYPAILEMSGADGQKRYLVFGGLTSEHALVANAAGQLVPVSTTTLEQAWTGRAIIPWKNVLRLSVPTPYMINSAERELLVRLLVAAGFWNDGQPSTSDMAVREALRGFQQQQGLESDGVAGGQTLMMLYRRTADFRTPILEKAENIQP